MLKEEGGEETGSGYAVNEAGGEREGTCKQPVCTGQKFKSICTKLFRYPNIPSSAISVTVTTSQSFDSSVLQLLPRARWREGFFLILRRWCSLRGSNRTLERSVASFELQPYSHAKLLLFLHLVTGAVGTFPCFFPPSIIILPAYLSCLHLSNFLLSVQESSSTSWLFFILKSSLKIHQYHCNRSITIH